MVSSYKDVIAADLTNNIQIGKETYKTNMKFSKKKKVQQKFLMHGPKFFDEINQYLLKNHELGEYALHSSALATYILLHYKVNDVGLLPRDFKLSDIANESDIPYTTIHTGFQALLRSGLVKEILIDEKIPVYEICNYARLNLTARESKDQDGGLSYFRLPNVLLETSILKELVSHRDSKGIIELLNLCNNFTRELKYKSKDSVEEYTFSRNMDSLKERLGRNAKKVRNYIEIISPIFKFNAAATKVRNPRKGRIARIREKIQQIVIIQFTVSMNPACVIENDQAEIRQIEAKMRKEAMTRFKSVGIALASKDRRDITVAFKNEISKIAAFIKDKKLRDSLMTYAMTYAMDQFESLLATGKKIKTIGGFVRAKFRESLVSWRDTYLDDATQHEILVKLVENKINVPDSLRLA
ncbi:hypothetical protein M3215_11935 [Bacillus cytotoxicus]|uniref:Uncharacterized protein n=1 Tax=Bacillus cytotoxicus TaxID=580165 RepID=A0ACC6A6Y7_9BACI|nr:hypothetical protein [Bacillus cytotoxicus]